MTSKYRNVRATVDGYKFQSLLESERYKQLKLLQHAGKISGLELQPRFKISVNGIKICTYFADFSYLEGGTLYPVVEDVKGVRTPLYKLKKNLMMAVYGIDVKEI